MIRELNESGGDSAKPPSWTPFHLAAILAMVLGAMGMAVSFHYLSLTDPRDIAAGNAGFIAGSVLIGSGLISLCLLVRCGP
jgi:hypothetical protein